jgi:hypothetical protein
MTKKIIEQAQVKNSNPANNLQESVNQSIKNQFFEPCKNTVWNSATLKMVLQEIQTQKDDKKK